MPAFLITKSNTRSPSSLDTPTPPRIDGGTSPMSCVVFVGAEENTRSDDVIDFDEGRRG